MVRRFLIAIGVLLALFHGWLLGSQLWSGQLADVSLVARWLLAAALLVGLRGLMRQGVPLFWSRKAVALWVLAALLHGPAVADRLGADASAAPEFAATLVQTVAPALFTGVLLLLLLVTGLRRRALARVWVPLAPARVPSLRQRDRLLLAPRPPPRSLNPRAFA